MAREIVPQLGGRNCVYTYMGWSLITAPDSLQYKLRADAGENYDAEGFAIIEGRYVIACTEAFGGCRRLRGFPAGHGVDIELHHRRR